MLVYRAPRASLDPRVALEELGGAARRLAASDPGAHDAWVELLIDAGQLETAVADALFTDFDGIDVVLDALGDVSTCCAHGAREAWHGAGVDAARVTTGRLVRSISAALAHTLPPSASVGVPEGYAYYALYPESYGEAARQFFHAARPRRALCVGVRTIGTSLAAVVAAELRSLGCDVRRWTVRPRGHPFDRRVRLAPALACAMADWRDGYALVVDEGPGLSGSSFAATAAALASLGFPAERIVFLPSWAADGATLVNDLARVRWGRHAKYVVGFDDLWLATGRLERLAGGPTVDYSAGKWRDHLIRDRRRYPAVQPQHEQRKYFAAASSSRPTATLLKFVGLGRYGRARLARAECLAAAGFGPRAVGLAEGFLRTEFISGEPLRVTRDAATIDRPLLERLADYLAFVGRSFGTGRSASFDSVAEMIATNVAEGLGAEWVPRAPLLARWRTVVDGTEAVTIDGRMLAHEWIRRGGEIYKTDALSHGNDHFWPGCQDIAWDIAAAVVELRLDPARAEALVARYRAKTGDADVPARLPFARVGYLASRLGYVSLAASTLGTSPDGARMRMLRRRYANTLRRCLTLLPGALDLRR